MNLTNFDVNLVTYVEFNFLKWKAQISSWKI